MRAIYFKEIKSFFNSMLGYVFCAVVIALIGIYFMANNLESGYQYFSYSLRISATIVMFMIPILTMRSFAEEKKSKTDQMLLTTPVKLYEIVIGKFFALATIYAIPLAIMAICPILMKFLGGTTFFLVDYLTLLTMFLYGSVFIAIGIFISSLTESQIIASVGSFAVIFLMVMWSGLSSYLPTTTFASLLGMYVFLIVGGLIIYGITKSGFMTMILMFLSFLTLIITYYIDANIIYDLYFNIIEQLDFGTAFSNVAYYFIFDISGLFMYLSTMVVFLILTIQGLNKRRWS